MDQFRETYNSMSKLEYELDDKRKELYRAKDNHSKSIMDRTIADLLKTQEENGKLNERDLNIFLNAFRTDVRNLFEK